MRIVVTGANGFVGRATCRAIISAGHALVPVSRTGMEPLGVADHQAVPVGEVSAETDWSAALDGADAVVHLVNPFLGGPDTPELRALGERVTVGGSVSLAHQAAKAGVRRLVFVSTLKVCGERSDAPLRPEDPPWPASAYGAIKKAAEVGMATALQGSETRLTIIRPPVVFGPGNRGTIHLLAAAIRQRPWIALPFGGARANARAMIFVDNLAAAFVAAATDAAAEDRVFHVKDRPALSTAELLGKLRTLLGHSPGLLPMPTAFLRLPLTLSGRTETASRLLDSFDVDDTAIEKALGWTPPISTDDGLRRTVQWLTAGEPDDPLSA